MRVCAQVLIPLFAVVLAGCGKPGVEAARESDLTPQAILSLDDQKFLDSAQRAEIRENTLAVQALDRTRDLQVRALATGVSDDMGVALSDLKNLMKAKQMAEPGVFAAETHSETAERLRSVSDDAFNHEFVSLLAAEGQDTIRIFDTAAQTAADPDVRTYAARVLPSLQANYNKAVDLEKKLAAH
jgi:putative membrane protein